MAERFWSGFVVGAATGVAGTIALVVAGLVWFGSSFTGPMLAVTAEIPTTAVVGQPFDVEFTIRNPHDEAVEFDNFDVPDRTLDDFDIRAAQPMDDSVSGFGSRTWFFDQDIPPGGQVTYRYTIEPLAAGERVFEAYVCNHYEDCTSVLETVDVSRDR
ncbi:MAG: hypothetical protein AAFZ58_16200 [Pseudomonadota bacterium]